MRDVLEHLEKLRVHVAECEMIRDLATDPHKRELFGRLADHSRALAADIEKAIATRQVEDTPAEPPAQTHYLSEAKRFRDKAAEAQQLADIAERRLGARP